LARDIGKPRPIEELPPNAQGFLDRRAAARAAKDWSESDALRDQLADLGVVVTDTAEGQTWRLG
jgi:cysteinyl-tRNA synthetase